MTKDEALTLALDALEREYSGNADTSRAIIAIKEALAQPEQEQTRDIGVEQDERVFARIAAMKKPPQPKPQPEQEPVAIYQYQMRNGLWVDHNKESHDYNIRHCQPSTIRVVYTIPPQPQPEERNFCPRCGKRTADLTAIHTCTPPKGKI